MTSLTRFTSSPSSLNLEFYSQPPLVKIPNSFPLLLDGGRRQRRRKAAKFETLGEKQEPWTPIDLQTDPCREAALMQKIENCINKLESSPFYQTLRNEVQSSPISHHFQTVLSSEFKMQMVIYGIGSIESYEPPRLQLSLAILLKRNFHWIGNIEVFDPILSATESRVLEALGFSVMSVNEHGSRQALKPTMFFMPHCEAELYNNLLQTNWKVNLLSNMVLFGNSFGTYQQMSEFKNLHVLNSAGHVLAVGRFTNEFRIKTTISDYYYNAFHDSSWHFFSPVLETDLQFIS
ncbi:hypothetical protein L6164_017862 [Bauhinia variegata]|uniref:Uncharacterized protein n=1 Tax=Bauhinia variegata TaxID=167791 RepID=A0ACB9NE77_BAUVA|nr:hypothetical protein L6164_017862 [Bauhinia variegata]